MSSDVLLTLREAGKTYPVRRQPGRELLGHLLGRIGPSSGHRQVLYPFSLEVRRGESVGIVGLNGAGKSTLLQLASGVLTPSQGSVCQKGRVAALLELGSGFNQEATGLDNIFLYAATLGLPRDQIEQRLDGIIDFSGLDDFIDAPVKTYSSGMQVRLAFSVATSVDPDILIVDEALSVGDGVFAKRSFDRIMSLREQGTALLLSSHALFHVDLFCQRTLWLDRGRVRAFGETKAVVPQYQEYLDQLAQPLASPASRTDHPDSSTAQPSEIEGCSDLPMVQAAQADLVRLIGATVQLDESPGSELAGHGGRSRLRVRFDIQASAEEPSPRAAVVVSTETGRILGTSVSPAGVFQARDDAPHRGTLDFDLPQLPLNNGRYRIGVYVLCAKARFVYTWCDPHAVLQVTHQGPHQGPWLIPGQWSAAPDACAR